MPLITVQPQITQLINDKAKTGIKDSCPMSSVGWHVSHQVSLKRGHPLGALLSGRTPCRPGPRQRTQGICMTTSCLQSHALSFFLLGRCSGWLKRSHPAGLCTVKKSGSAMRASGPQFPAPSLGKWKLWATLGPGRGSSSHLGKQKAGKEE